MSRFLLALLLLAAAPPCAFSALRTQSSREKAAADDELEVRDEEEEVEQKNAPAEAKPAERGSDAFAQLDRNGDKRLTCSEFVKLLRTDQQASRPSHAK